MSTVTQKQVDEAIVDTEIQTIELVGKKHTLVAVKLKNGFTVIETTTCVDPANYSEEIGAEICLSKIKDKIWMLEGYVLQTKLNPAPTTFLERLVTEEEDLSKKILALYKFLETDIYRNLPSDQRDDLREQVASMVEYQGILSVRLKKLTEVA